MEKLLMEVVKPVVEIVMSRAAKEIQYTRNFKDELRKLVRKMQMIGSTVGSMIEVKDAAVEQWLRNALCIIYEVEYLLDVLAYEKHRANVRERRRVIWAPLKKAYFRRRMGSRIRSITGDFEDALREAQTIVQLKELREAHTNTIMQLKAFQIPATINDHPLQEVRRHVDTFFFIGRDSDVRSVVGMLCNPQHSHNHLILNRRISVVAIVGLGGIGKTSLAKQVYKNENVITHFHARIWISNLKEFDIERILNEMVESLGRGNRENYRAETAVTKLEEQLSGKRYLLVLDDVWNKNTQHWNSMMSRLESISGSMESMVLVTTRGNDVAEAMHASSVHHLSELSEDDSWSLFKQIAFENCPEGDASPLRESGMKITKKCKGVPLAISSIAGLLQTKRIVHEWEIVEKSELWNISDDTTGILPSLKLSYDYLSSPMLKKCFSACAFQPKNYSFDRYDLVDRWIALGLIQKSNNENLTLEDIGERYLNELLSISFLFVKRRNEIGEAIKFYWHDLVYDLARSVATHERLYIEVEKEVNHVSHIRYLSVLEHAEITPGFLHKLVLEKLHSLDYKSQLPLPKGVLNHMRYLCILDLGNSSAEELPEVIGELKCLKLLKLAKTPIKVLPEWVMKLYNLQSLILYQCDQLSFHGGQLSNLVNLRHLGLSFDFSPAEGVLQQLCQLHTLPPLQISEGGFQISELDCLHHIKGNLEIKGLELIKSRLDAENANLSKKSRVEQLRLRWDKNDNCTNQEEVLDGLCPHPNLKLLSIKGYAGDKFPSWLTRMNICQEGNAITFSNIMKIELIDCGRCQQLPTLGHLGSLKMIEIRNMGYVKQIGPEFYGGAALGLLRSNETQASGNCSSSMEKSRLGVHFASLKELRLHHLRNLEEWCEVDGESFPWLEKLVIEECPKLKGMPHHFPSLKELTVKQITSSHPLVSIMTSRKGTFRGLQKLHIERVAELTDIPAELGECTSLQTLDIWMCDKLRSLPENLSKLLSLKELRIRNCLNLECLPNLRGLSSLRILMVFGNENLREVPEGLQSCFSLEQLHFSRCRQLETLPDLAGLNSLGTLGIRGMTKMIMQPPEWLYTLPCLREVHIGNYEELNEFPDLSPLLKITSLRALAVAAWEPLQSLPEQLRHFTKLTGLGIFDFNNLQDLPDWLSQLLSLRQLFPTRCKKLERLPSKDAMDRLTNLVYLEIEDCPLLGEAIKKDGLEHYKIDAARVDVKTINSTN